MSILPETLDYLTLAEQTPPRRVKSFPHQITFPIHNDAQLGRLREVLWRKNITPTHCGLSSRGLRMGFASDDDAVLIKMSFSK